MSPYSSPKSIPQQRSSISSKLSVNSGFTLIELLSVIAIVGILVAILIPAVGTVRMNAYKAETSSDLRQVYAAVSLYAGDHSGTLPGPTHTGVGGRFDHDKDKPSLCRYLSEYLTKKRITDTAYTLVEELMPATHASLVDVAAEDYQYDGTIWLINNDFLGGTMPQPFGYPEKSDAAEKQPQKIMMIPDPARNVLLYGLDAENVEGTPGWIGTLPQRPLFNGERPFLFWDGHVEISERMRPEKEEDQ